MTVDWQHHEHYTPRVRLSFFEHVATADAGDLGYIYHLLPSLNAWMLFGSQAAVRFNTTRDESEAVELATLEWVEWFNHRRLFGPIGDLTPVEKEVIYYQNQEWAKVA